MLFMACVELLVIFILSWIGGLIVISASATSRVLAIIAISGVLIIAPLEEGLKYTFLSHPTSLQDAGFGYAVRRAHLFCDSRSLQFASLPLSSIRISPPASPLPLSLAISPRTRCSPLRRWRWDLRPRRTSSCPGSSLSSSTRSSPPPTTRSPSDG